MVFKSFRFRIIVRILILFGLITMLSWCLVTGFYLRSVYIGAAVIILLVELLWYIDRFNRDVKNFLISLQQRDFTTHYQTETDKSFADVYEILNQITASFKKISTEKEIQHRYLEMLVQHLQVGILSIDENGKIHLVNDALKRLLKKNVLTTLKSFEVFDSALLDALRNIGSGETRLVKLRINSELLQLSMHASEFRLDNQYFKLVSLQNIRSELDRQEIESWQKLIRVLSHEIMNSVAPIMSLSDTLHGLVIQNRSALQQTSQYNAMDKGLQAIRTRSEGLYNFTESYRKLTGVLTPAFKDTSLKDLVGRVHLLLQSQLMEKRIDFQISVEETVIFADPDLMEQVLINLLLNAIKAVENTAEPVIEIASSGNGDGRLCLSLRDNGEGIDESTIDKIFIPFFTTRKNGSGIGLAITKQILQLHRADIHVKSALGKGTEVNIVF